MSARSLCEYLLCMDWSEMNLSQVLAYISNYALVLDTNAIGQNSVAMVFNKLWRTVFSAQVFVVISSVSLSYNL